MDVVIPIVFPDYRITVETKTFEVDLFPYSEIDNLKIPSFSYIGEFRDDFLDLDYAKGTLHIEESKK